MAQSKKHKNSKKSRKNKQIIITSIIAILVLIVIVMIVTMGTSKQTESTTYAAVVNDEKIEMAYVDKMYNTIDPTVKMQLTKFDFLNMSIIPDTLLYQEVQKAGMTVTDEEVQADIDASLLSMGISNEDLNAQLAAVNSSYDEFYGMTRKKLETLKYVNDNFLPLDVTDEEAKAFFDENVEAFKYNLGENVTYELVSEGIKVGIQIESQKAMVMEKVNELRKSAKILVNNKLLESES